MGTMAGGKIRLWTCVFIVGILGGILAQAPVCGQAPAGKKRVVCSTTQVADFARNVLGDRWEVECVLAAGQDPHTYQTTTADARQVANANLCLENGLHLEGNDWMKKLAENAGCPIVTCTDGIDALEIDEEGQRVRDPHAWFRPDNAAQYVRNIARAAVQLDPKHRQEYEARAECYLLELGALHRWIQRQVHQIPLSRRKLITNHDAFGYFCAAYGFEAMTPVGWSTKDEIGGGGSIQRQKEVLESIRSSGVPAIFMETSINPRMMKQLAEEAGVVIGGSLYSDSMGAEGTAGETYIGMMRENVLMIVSGLATDPEEPLNKS
jgi:manganese/iron transport system substrate-binding protein